MGEKKKKITHLNIKSELLESTPHGPCGLCKYYIEDINKKLKHTLNVVYLRSINGEKENHVLMEKWAIKSLIFA